MATLIGVGINFSPISSIKALFWSAVINGIVAVPDMAIDVHLANTKIMDKFPVSGLLKIIGWAATFVMTVAVVGMCITVSIG